MIFLHSFLLPATMFYSWVIPVWWGSLYPSHCANNLKTQKAVREFTGTCLSYPLSILNSLWPVRCPANEITCLGHFEGTGLEDGLQLRGTRGVNYTGPTDDRQRTVVAARNSIEMYECIHGRARSQKTEWQTEASRYGVVGQPEKSKQRIPGLGSIEGFQEHHGNPQIWKRESSSLGPFPFPWVSDGWAICHGRVWNSSSHATSLFLSPCPLTTI